MENSINTYRIRYLKDTSLQTAYVQGKDQKEATKEFFKIFINIQSEKVLSVVNIQETKEEYDISKIIKIAASIFIALIVVYGIYLGWNSYNQMNSNKNEKYIYPSYTKKETINTFSSKKRSDPKSERRKDLRNSNSYSSSRDSFVFPKVFNSAEKSRCFEYDKPYTFKGKIVKKVYYDNETGNHNFLALELYKPICTLPKEYARRESEITHMQISSGGSNMVQKLEGRHVELKGSLYHSDNAHHFTKVLISLKSIERKESNSKSADGKDSINLNSNFSQEQARSYKTSNQHTNSERQELEQLRAEKAKAAQEKQDTVNLENENISLSVHYKKSENKVSFTVHTVNKYANAKGGASISFPDIKEKGKIHKISKSGFDSIDIYPSGKKIWNGKLKKQIVSGYSLVEGWSKKWKKGRDNRLVFEVDTRGLKQLRVNIRALLLKNKNEKWLPIDGREDQQGYPAKQLVIELSNRKINDSSKEFDSALANETLCSNSDVVVLSCNIKQKILSVCHQKDNKFVYKYGKPHKVELTISSKPLYSHNQFIRANVESRLRFHNKGYDYIVYSNDFLTYDKHPYDGTGAYKAGHGVYVVKNNKLLADLKCNKTYPDMGDIYRFRDSFRHEKYSFLDGR